MNDAGKRWVVAGFAAVSFAAGALESWARLHRQQGAIDLLGMLLTMALLFGWYYADTEQRRYRRTPALNLCMVAIAPFALVFYLLHSRGWLRGVVAIAAAIAVGLAGNLLHGLGRLAAHGLVS